MPFESQANDVRNGISDIDMSIDGLGVVVLCNKDTEASLIPWQSPVLCKKQAFGPGRSNWRFFKKEMRLWSTSSWPND